MSNQSNETPFITIGEWIARTTEANPELLNQKVLTCALLVLPPTPTQNPYVVTGMPSDILIQIFSLLGKTLSSEVIVRDRHPEYRGDA